MLVTAIMTTLCTAGIVFYLRFLVALCKERRTGLCGYWLRLHLHWDGERQREQEIEIIKRAA